MLLNIIKYIINYFALASLICYNIHMKNLNNDNRYNKLKPFLINKFGSQVGKICIDANFTCPNRDGKVTKGGCIFCSSKGSR